MTLIKQREVTILLGIIVEKRKSTHPWGDFSWVPVAVFLNGDRDANWVELGGNENVTRYHGATLPMTLHRKETEALRINLMLPEPELYVVLQENDDHTSPFPYVIHHVTASSYEAQDYHDAGDDIIEKVAMPEPVAALIQAFIEEHHVDEVFIKRKRDKLKLEDQKFGKNPIFSRTTKH